MTNWGRLDSMPRKPGNDDFPISYYEKLASAAITSCASEYLEATHFLWAVYDDSKAQIEREKTGAKARKAMLTLESKKFEAENAIEVCMNFFKSDRFDIFMPNTDKEWFIDAIQEKAKRTCFQRFRF